MFPSLLCLSNFLNISQTFSIFSNVSNLPSVLLKLADAGSIWSTLAKSQTSKIMLISRTFWFWNGAKVCQSCRSWTYCNMRLRWGSNEFNEHSLATVGFDTAEDWPYKARCKGLTLYKYTTWIPSSQPSSCWAPPFNLHVHSSRRLQFRGPEYGNFLFSLSGNF